MNSIRHTLKAEVLLKMSADEPRPVIEPHPMLEIDSELLATFLMEPEPEVINLGPLATLQRDSTSGKKKLRPERPDAVDALDVSDATCLTRTQIATAPCIWIQIATASTYRTERGRTFFF